MADTLSREEEWRLGVLTWCAERGMTAAEATEHLKQASFAGAIGSWLSWPATLAMLAPGLGLAGGALGGHLLAKGMQHDDIDAETAKKYELIAAYRQHADAATRARRVNYMKSSPLLKGV